MRRDQNRAADASAESAGTVSDSIVDDTSDSDASASRHAAIPAFLQPDHARKEDGIHSHKEDGGDPETVDAEEGERKLPPVSMLHRNAKKSGSPYSSKELEQTAAALQSTLAEFGLHSRVVGWISGPTVTTFKVQPGEGERVSRISNLEDDIALSLATDSVRIFAPIPGTSLVGIEIPNRSRENVSFGDILPYVKGGPLEFALGRDAEGTPMVADLAKMPHLLVAGATAGSITIRNLNHISLQADLAIIEALARAGAEIITTNSSVTVHGGPLHAFEFDATDCPDLFPALAALAASCEGTSVLTGTQRLTYKESNRAETIAEVFGRLGIGVDLSEENTMRITGGPVSSAVVDSHNDHRIAMAAAIAALSSDDSVVIEGADAADKSYPNFWNDLDTLRS